MHAIVCLRDQLKLDEYLNKLAREAGTILKAQTWDDSQMDLQSPAILVLDQDKIDVLQEICDERDLKILIALNSRKDFKLVSQLKDYFPKIFGFIDLSQEVEYNIPILKNYLAMNFTSHSLNLDKLATDLDKVYEFTKSELMRVKELHDRLVKVRVDTLKGVTITSKFMAGEKSGGEFFDMIQTDHNLLFIQAGSSSYILSSLILSELEVLKLSSPTTSLKFQSEHFIKMINHHAKENNFSVNYCVMNVDLKNLTADFSCQGQGKIYYQKKLLDFSESISIKLKPSERLCILSQGALKNLVELNEKLSLNKFYEENADKSTRDLINEFFFEVSRNKAGNFLNYDAIMAVIEIDQKTLYQL